MKCQVCEFIACSREQLAGHLSGHVRRGELQKQVYVRQEHRCKVCDQVFETCQLLSGHMHSHVAFDDILSKGGKKTRLLQERGHRCESCGLTEWLGQPIPITMDHIDGNSDNDSKENLRLLCPNCHAQTPTFSGKNVGRFPYAKRYEKRRKIV